MIKVYTNSLGSGDWVNVQSVGQLGFEVLHEGHRVQPFDLVMILQNLGIHAELVELTDEQLEEGEYQ